MKKILSTIVIVVCAGTLALGGDGAVQTPERRQPGAAGGGGGRGGNRGNRAARQGGQRAGNAARQPRERLVARLLRQTSPEDLPVEIREWAEETKLIALQLASLTKKIEDKEKELLESPELAPLLAAYIKAHTEYRNAVAANEAAAKASEGIAAIEKAQQELMAGIGGGNTNWQELRRTVRDQRTKQRALETEIAQIIAKDEGIQKLEAPRRKAASTFMTKHTELKEKDAEVVKMKAEMEALTETQGEIDRAVENLAREKGLIAGGNRTTTPAAPPAQ
ncbi:hypothetical protein ACFL01_02790 [Planctomycetota bacterium]